MDVQLSSTMSRRVVELDSLRALAAINLMLFHFTHVYSVKYGYSSPLGFEWPYGKYGVQLFFMLSGFVNALTLYRKQQPGEFIVSRLIRILPSFYLVVGLNLLLLQMMPLSGFTTYTWPQVAASLTLVPQLLGFDCLEPVTWTLQIEVLFYGWLVFLFVSGSMERPLRPLMSYLLLCLIAGSLVVGPASNEVYGWSGATAVWLSELMLLQQMPLFVIGILLHEIIVRGRKLLPNGLGIVAAGIVFHCVDDHGHNPLVTVLLTGVLVLAAQGKIPVMRTVPLVFISSISYSLYLLHNNLGCVLIFELDQLGLPPWLCLLVTVPLAILVSTIATFWLERPISNWLRATWRSFHFHKQESPSCIKPNA